ncbi:MAG: hypothetical protein EXS01_01270 [Phycisphaerales bacterium]|nr:hypothetical protein [Phycisphaerales bacterium]
MILVVVATPQDAAKFLGDPEQRRFGARDTGGGLRHEHTHALHFGQMVRLHQLHPIWAQEGLATLFQDWRIGDKGRLVMLPNLRSNDLADRLRRGQAMPWTDFRALESESFTAPPRWNDA